MSRNFFFYSFCGGFGIWQVIGISKGYDLKFVVISEHERRRPW